MRPLAVGGSVVAVVFDAGVAAVAGVVGYLAAVAGAAVGPVVAVVVKLLQCPRGRNDH